MKLTALLKDKRRSAAAQTVRAQAVAAENPDELRWDIFAQRAEARGLMFSESSDVDFRFVAERRAYNTRGIEMPEQFGTLREFMHLPIQAKKTIDEEEIEALGAATEDEAILLELLGASIPGRTDKLTRADYRRLEADFFRSWATGTILAKNVNTKAVAIVSFGFAAKRYKTAATAWSDAGVNAYEEAVKFYRAGKNMTGGGEGLYLSGALLEAIREDAPRNLVTGLPLGDAEIAALIAGQTGGQFRFVVDDRVHDVAAAPGEAGYDAKTGTRPERIWPVGAAAVIPAGVRVGEVRFSPVRRASTVSGATGAAKTSNRDVTIVYVTNNDETSLEMQAQLNAYPALNESKVAVIETGVTE